jgi:hypothetical protein
MMNPVQNFQTLYEMHNIKQEQAVSKSRRDTKKMQNKCCVPGQAKSYKIRRNFQNFLFSSSATVNVYFSSHLT